MNKILSTLALMGLTGTAFAGGAALPDLSVSAKISAESEYIFRGKEHSDKNLQTLVSVEYSLGEAAVYANAFMMSPYDQVANEFISTIGAKTTVDKFLVDAGYSHYGYPNRNQVGLNALTAGTYNAAVNRFLYSDTNEVYFRTATSMWKDIFTPEAMISYNFDLKQTSYEAALRKEIGADEFIPGVKVILAGFAGYIQADRENGDQGIPGTQDYKNDYGYIGASLDLAVAVSNSGTIGAGVRYAWNSDGNEDSLGRNAANTDENFWYGVWAKFAY